VPAISLFNPELVAGHEPLCVALFFSNCVPDLNTHFDAVVEPSRRLCRDHTRGDCVFGLP
jgi:hypothetical protein